MKRTAKPITQQFNLSLVSAPVLAISQEKQNELKRALVELLTSAACPAGETRNK
jgi:hypothetical protein